MRYIIYGAGAVGGVIGARLHQAGHEVVLICRGEHLEAIQRDGLALRTPHETVTLPISAVGHPREIEFRDDDVVFLTMKSQHTSDALEDLRNCVSDVPVVCAQNGVANERMALRRFPRVYGMMVMLPASHLRPGEVLMHASPLGGILDAGRYPDGEDEFVEHVTADLSACGFKSRVFPNIMRFKYGKLLENLANAVQALCGTDARAGGIVRAVRAEALACYEAAWIDSASLEETMEIRDEVARSMRPIEGYGRDGGSTWQSLARGAGSIETDFLNGEIALLGALHGVPTPYNRMLQRMAAEAVREGRGAGSYAVEELMARV